MMKKILRLFTSAILLFGISTTSNASTITDTVEQNIYLNTWQSYQYSHDISDDGFALGNALSGTLSIDLYDDNRGYWAQYRRDFKYIPDGFEATLFTIADLDLDTGDITINGNDFYNSLDVQALASLNYNGLLNVTVFSLLGDFYLRNSVLTVDVPEPSTIIMMLLALFSFAIIRIRKSNN